MEKKYIINNEKLMSEWDWDKNNENGLDAHSLTEGSHKRAWWKCNKGHEWETPIYSRSNGFGCPYCSGRLAVKGYNDLQTVNPNLAKQWNNDKNDSLSPMDVLPNSGKKVWWKCNKGHEWQATVANMSYGYGCPYCAGRYAIKGKNDLQTVNPSLAKEWHFEKNKGLMPCDVLPNSNKKVWWKCRKGHEWQSTIANRSNGNGCPYCSGRLVIKGENDLQTVNPSLAKEWHFEKNGNLTPETVTTNCGKKVWWRCSKGHEWQATVNDRSGGTNCPICNSERRTSFPEYAIVYYLEQNGLEVIHSFNGYGYELDIYIPSLRIAIEYDGYYWHKNKLEKDIEKNNRCLNDGIKLYRIREALSPLYDSSIDYIVQKKQNDLSEILVKVFRSILGVSVDVNLERDAIAIENLRELLDKEQSILHCNPEIAREWNYEKNGKLKPEQFSTSSGKKVWWKCSKGHEWQATIASRNNGTGCPYCAGQKVLIGYNDLQTINPVLATEWHYDKNQSLKPSDFMSNSTKKVWWKCSKGHEWQATIASRNNGKGCPYCSGRYAIKGENDLQTVNPNLASEWNHEKNQGLTPSEVLPYSNKKVWWRCNKGHEWQAIIANRSKGRGCPVCRSHKHKS